MTRIDGPAKDSRSNLQEPSGQTAPSREEGQINRADSMPDKSSPVQFRRTNGMIGERGRAHEIGLRSHFLLLTSLVVAELRREQIGHGTSRPLDRVGVLIERVEIEPEIVSVGVVGNRQGQEGLGLKLLAELAG
jgi:hypothetical protein